MSLLVFNQSIFLSLKIVISSYQRNPEIAAVIFLVISPHLPRYMHMHSLAHAYTHTHTHTHTHKRDNIIVMCCAGPNC